LVLRGTLLDGYRIALPETGGGEVLDHWQLDLWDADTGIVGAEGVAFAKRYFQFQDERHRRFNPSNEWKDFSPGTHAELYDSVDIDGNGEEEFPVTQQGVLHFVSSEGKVVRSWATRQGLAGFIYGSKAIFKDLDGNGQSEVILSLGSAYYWKEHPEINFRGVAVYSPEGKELSQVRLPSYVKLEGFSGFRPGRGEELFFVTDSTGNKGYEMNVNYRGEKVALNDFSGIAGLLSFEGVNPKLAWLAYGENFRAPPSSAMLAVRSAETGMLWVFVVHHTMVGGLSPYTELFEFNPTEDRLISLGKTDGTVGIPQWGPVVTGSNLVPLFITQQKQWLRLVEPNLSSLHRKVMLPGEHSEKSAGLGTIRLSDSKTLVLSWSGDERGELAVFEIHGDSIHQVLTEQLHRPILQVTPVETSKNETILLVFTDQPEFWKLQTNADFAP